MSQEVATRAQRGVGQHDVFTVRARAVTPGGAVGLLLGGDTGAGNERTRIWYTSARYVLFRLLGHKGTVPLEDDYAAAIAAGDSPLNATAPREPLNGFPDRASLQALAPGTPVEEIAEEHALDLLGVSHLLIDELHERHFDAEVLLVVVRRLVLADVRRRLREIIKRLKEGLEPFAEAWAAAIPRAKADAGEGGRPEPAGLDLRDASTAAAVRVLAAALQLWANRPRVVLLSATYDENKLRDFLLAPFLELLRGFWADVPPATQRFMAQWSVNGLAGVTGAARSRDAFEGALRVPELLHRSLCIADGVSDGSHSLLKQQAVRAARAPNVHTVMLDDFDDMAAIDSALDRTLGAVVDNVPVRDHVKSLVNSCSRLCSEWDDKRKEVGAGAPVRLKVVDRKPQEKKALTAVAAALALERAVCAFPSRHDGYDPEASPTQGDAVLVFNATAADIDAVYRNVYVGARVDRDLLLVDGDTLCDGLTRRSAVLGLCSAADLARSLPRNRLSQRLDRKDVREVLLTLPHGPPDVHHFQLERLIDEVMDEARGRLDKLGTRGATVSPDRRRLTVCEAATDVVHLRRKLVLVKLHQAGPALAALDLLEEARKNASRRRPASPLVLLRNASVIFLATAVAETSLTLDRVHTVIDTGVYRDATGFPPGYGGATLDQLWVSAAAAQQRKGRAGRTARPYPGFRHVAYRLYTSALTKLVGEHAPAALLQYPAKSLVLRMKVFVERFPNMTWEAPTWSMQSGSSHSPREAAANIPLLTLIAQTLEPSTVAILRPAFGAAFAELHAVGALSAPVDQPHTSVTWAGQLLEQLPPSVGPEAGLFVLAGLRLGSLPEALVMAATSALYAKGANMVSLFESWMTFKRPGPMPRELRKAYAFSLLGREDSTPHGKGQQLAWSEHILAVRAYMLFRHLRFWHESNVAYNAFKDLGIEPNFLTDMHAIVVALCDKLQRLFARAGDSPVAVAISVAVSRAAEALGDPGLETIYLTDRSAWHQGMEDGRPWPGLSVFAAPTDVLRRLIAAATGHAVAEARVTDPLGGDAWRRQVAASGSLPDLDPLNSVCLGTARVPVHWTLTQAMLAKGPRAFQSLTGKPLFSALEQEGLLCAPDEATTKAPASRAFPPPSPCAGMLALSADAVMVSLDPAAAEGASIGRLLVAHDDREEGPPPVAAKSLAKWLFKSSTDKGLRRSGHGAVVLPRRLVVLLGGFSEAPPPAPVTAGVAAVVAPVAQPTVAAPPPLILALLSCVAGVPIRTAGGAITREAAAAGGGGTTRAGGATPGDRGDSAATAAAVVEATAVAADNPVKDAPASADDAAALDDLEGADPGAADGTEEVRWGVDPGAEADDEAISVELARLPVPAGAAATAVAGLVGADAAPRPPPPDSEAPLAAVAGGREPAAVPWLSSAMVDALATLAGPAAALRELQAGLPLRRPFLPHLLPGTAPPLPLGQTAAPATREPEDSSVRPFHPDEIELNLRVCADDLPQGAPNRCFPIVGAFSHARVPRQAGALAPAAPLYATVGVSLLEPDWRKRSASALRLCGMNILWSDPRAVLLALVAVRPSAELRVAWGLLPPSADGTAAAGTRRLGDACVLSVTFDAGTVAEHRFTLPCDKPLALPRLLSALRVRRHMLALSHALALALPLRAEAPSTSRRAMGGWLARRRGAAQAGGAAAGSSAPLSEDGALRALLAGTPLEDEVEAGAVPLPPECIPGADAADAVLNLGALEAAWAFDAAPPMLSSTADDIASLCGLPSAPLPGAFADDDDPLPSDAGRGADVLVVLDVADSARVNDVTQAVSVALGVFGDCDRVCLIDADAPRRRSRLIATGSAGKAHLSWLSSRVRGVRKGGSDTVTRIAGALRIAAGVLADRRTPRPDARVVLISMGHVHQREAPGAAAAPPPPAIAAALQAAARECSFGERRHSGAEPSAPEVTSPPRCAQLCYAVVGVGSELPAPVRACQSAVAACGGLVGHCDDAGQLQSFMSTALAHPTAAPAASGSPTASPLDLFGDGTITAATRLRAALASAFPATAFTPCGPGPASGSACTAACDAHEAASRHSVEAQPARRATRAPLARATLPAAPRRSAENGFRVAKGPPDGDGNHGFDGARRAARELRRPPQPTQAAAHGPADDDGAAVDSSSGPSGSGSAAASRTGATDRVASGSGVRAAASGGFEGAQPRAGFAGSAPAPPADELEWRDPRSGVKAAEAPPASQTDRSWRRGPASQAHTPPASVHSIEGPSWRRDAIASPAAPVSQPRFVSSTVPPGGSWRDRHPAAGGGSHTAPPPPGDSRTSSSRPPGGGAGSSQWRGK